MPDRLLSPRQAVDRLRERGVRHTEKTLAKKRSVGGGPVFYRIGRNIGYAPSDLDAYADRLISAPYSNTAEYQVARARP